MTWGRAGFIGLVGIAAAFVHPLGAVGQAEPDRYEGTMTVDFTPSSYNPNFPNNPDAGPTKALVKATCTDDSCTIAEEPLGGVGFFLGEDVEYPLTVPVGGSISLPRFGADGGSLGCGSPADVPEGTLSLTKDGDSITLVADFPEYKVSPGDCVAWDEAVKTTFTGELTAADSSSSTENSGQGEPRSGSGSETGNADEGNGTSNDSGSSPAVPIIGSAAVLLAAAAGAGVLYKRRGGQPNSPPTGSQPNVRPVPDTGRQTVTASGPAVVSRIRPVPDAHPRITISLVSPAKD